MFLFLDLFHCILIYYMHMMLAFLYTSSKQSENKTQFYLQSYQNISYLEINLTKEQELYIVSDKILLREIKEDLKI